MARTVIVTLNTRRCVSRMERDNTSGMHMDNEGMQHKASFPPCNRHAICVIHIGVARPLKFRLKSAKVSFEANLANEVSLYKLSGT
jgi:hypothetical protein